MRPQFCWLCSFYAQTVCGKGLWLGQVFGSCVHWFHQVHFDGAGTRHNSCTDANKHSKFCVFVCVRVSSQHLSCSVIHIILFAFQKTQRDKLIEQIFCIPMTRIELHENDAYPHKIRISTENLAYVNYTISFSAIRKKKQFMEAIRAQRNVSMSTDWLLIVDATGPRKSHSARSWRLCVRVCFFCCLF